MINRRSFIKLVGLAIAGLFVKPEQAAQEWHFAPIEIGSRQFVDELEGNWESYISEEEPFHLETGCGDPANWTTPEPVEATGWINRHFFCIRWDLDGERYELDGLPISKEEMEELLEVKLNLDFPEGTFLGWI